MNNYINNLYNGKIYPAEQTRPDTQEYQINQMNLSDLLMAFENMLTPSLKATFEGLLETQHKGISMELQAAFAYGFKLGANLMVESLTCPTNKDQLLEA